eukprot:6598576-Ditylum_brightwellii.AAC.1
MEYAAKPFDALVKGGMDTAKDMEENKEVVNKDKLDNCWKKPSRSVYSDSFITDTHISTVIGIIENWSLMKPSGAEAAFLKKAAKQMDE